MTESSGPSGAEGTGDPDGAGGAVPGSFDPRAVIEGRVPGRTPVAFIAGTAATAACALVALGIDAAQSVAAGDGVAPFATALPLALVPVPLLIALVLYIDRLEPEPRGNLVFAFAWGAGIAALFALIINTADLEYVTMPALGASTGEYVAATFGAPVIEETLKGLVLVGLLWRRRAEFDGPTDGVIYACMAGLGFAMIENVGYYISALVNPERGGIALLGYTFVLRGVVSPLLHPIFTSMTGIGVAVAASRGRGGARAVALGWLAAVLLHGTWNGLSLFGTAGLISAYLVMSCVLIALAVTLVADRRRLIGLIRRYLSAYIRTGLVTPDDVTMLASLRARAQARAWARAVGGLPAAAAMADYQLAATELALARAKGDRGVLRFEAFAAREHDLLALMAVARHAFTRRQPAPAPAPWSPAGASAFTMSDDLPSIRALPGRAKTTEGTERVRLTQPPPCQPRASSRARDVAPPAAVSRTSRRRPPCPGRHAVAAVHRARNAFHRARNATHRARNATAPTAPVSLGSQLHLREGGMPWFGAATWILRAEMSSGAVAGQRAFRLRPAGLSVGAESGSRLPVPARWPL